MRQTPAFRLRSEDGKHRQATWLELFFDLAFVLCVAAFTHHVEQIWLIVPVWWVWNQFTWYSSHFDNDDVLFRLFMLSGVGGSLCLAYGLGQMSHGSSNAFVLSYLFLHLLLAAAWIRAYRHVLELRPYIRLKLVGILLGLVCWSASLFFAPPLRYALWGLGISLQLLLPVFAWTMVAKVISLHYHHLKERHGLFAIIVMGECLVTLLSTLPEAPALADSLKAAAIFIVLCSLWWTYFDWKQDERVLSSTSTAFVFNYGHLFVYTGLGLVASGIRHGVALIASGIVLFLISLFAIKIFGATRKA